MAATAVVKREGTERADKETVEVVTVRAISAWDSGMDTFRGERKRGSGRSW